MELKLLTKKKSFVDKVTGESKEYNALFLLIGNVECEIKPIFKDNKRLLVAFAEKNVGNVD